MKSLKRNIRVPIDLVMNKRLTSDEKMFYVINILQNLEEMSSNRPADKKQAMEALQNVLKFSGRLPEDFDADKELQEAREEKYGNIG